MGARDIVKKLLNDEIEVLRSLKGSHDQNGQWTEPEPAVIPMMAGVQEASGADLELVPEGYRTKRVIKLYVENELKIASKKDKIKADFILWDNEIFQVKNLRNWNHITGHCRAIAVKIDQ